jgi:hypothetical protein
MTRMSSIWLGLHLGVRARVRFRVMIGARVSDSAHQTLLIVQNSPVLPDKETMDGSDSNEVIRQEKTRQETR